MATTAPWIQRATISEDVLKGIYASDQDMYPAPLTYGRLESWVASCPELSICFQTASEEGEDTVAVGAIIVLPIVKKYWDDILVGKLKETDIDPATMFAGNGGADVGLHVFHIERFESFNPLGRLRHFAEFALEDTREIVEKKGWNILGYSALTATPAGRAVCKRMGFKPTGYEEIFMTSEATGPGNRNIEMVFVYPGQQESAHDTKERDLVLSKSEMVVRYLNDRFWNGE